MGDLTFSELREQIHLNLEQRSELYNQIPAWINQAQTRIARAHRWEELKRLWFYTLTVGADTIEQRYLDRVIELPLASIRDIYTLRIITNDGRSETIELITPKQMDANNPEPEYYARNKPTHAAFYGKYLELNRAPDEAYKLRARMDIWPAPLGTSQPDNKSNLEQKDDVIIQLATSLGWQGTDREKSNHAYNIASRMLSEAVAEERERPGMDIQPSFENDEAVGEYWRNPWINDMR